MTDPKAVDCRFTLVGTTHPGNIGAAARAMKTMGLEGLDLVSPDCRVDENTRAMAASAYDVVEQGGWFDDLPAALADRALVLGLTARPRRDGVPALTPRQAAALVVAESVPTAVLFGRERTGLTNDELASCQRLVHIPANPDYPSLNLAAAVQLMAYELWLARLDATAGQSAGRVDGDAAPPATGAHLEGLHQTLARAVEVSGYSATAPRAVLLRRLRNLFNRARPSADEVDLLRGLFKRLLP
ncbi:RNA methyltransferase [Spiribacter pallidus]|uniref:tRNA (cytidine/uridine-2'-O-)-methyltransferase TrmJ n=1 Tax=Spiribacter pallidus TaxID=1987936 RepID=A0ABV3TBH5_9GAMM